MSSRTPNSDDRPVRVLLVDDDEDDYHLTKSMLREMPKRRFTLDWEPDFEAARVRICRGEHDVYLIDYRLGSRTGLELLHSLREQKCSGPTILLTGQGELEVDHAAEAAGAADYLEKSRMDGVVLERMIRYAMRQHTHELDLECKVAERTAALEAANEALREADRRKDEFLATLAHELRNPLGSIRHALEYQRLMAGDLAALERTRPLIERQVQQLVRLIDDLLDASRFTRGKLQLNLEPLDLRGAIAMAVETSQSLFEKAGVTLTVGCPDKAMKLTGDRVRLVQLFTNILNNAAKYTPVGGTVVLTATTESSRHRATIADTGVGIPAEHLPQVFDLFTQIDRTLNRSEGGLGIGLALVKRLVEMHRGEVIVESPGIDRGTTVSVMLPK